MADATTVYEIHARYMFDDRGATQGVRKLTQQTATLAGAWRTVRDSVRGFTDVWYSARAAMMGMQAIKAPLVDFNAELEQARITMAGMLRLNLGGNFTAHFGEATEMVKDFQQIAKVSVGTTMDFVRMAQMITRPVTAAKLGMQDLRDITAGAVVAARAMGIQAEMAALDIEQGLMGMLTKRERFLRALIEPIGFTDTAAFNKLTAEKRAEVIRTALTQPAIREMAKAQELSFEGVTSTLADNLQIALGKVGLPLFQRLTEEVRSWNTWIEANGSRIEEIGRELGDALVSGFETVRSVVAFIVEERDTLMAIAQGFLAFKVGQMGVGVAGALGRQVKGVMSALTRTETGLYPLADAATKASAGLGGVAMRLVGLAPHLGALAIAAKGLFDIFSAQRKEEERQRREILSQAGAGSVTFSNLRKLIEAQAEVQRLRTIQRGENLPGIGRTPGRDLTPREQVQLRQAETQMQMAQEAQREFDRSLARFLFEKNAFTEQMELDTRRAQELRDQLFTAFGDHERNLEAFQRTVFGLEKRYSPKELRDLIADVRQEEAEEALPTLEADVEAARRLSASNVNVTINKIEVAAADPNRFVHDMTAAFEQFNRAPTQAEAALRGGL